MSAKIALGAHFAYVSEKADTWNLVVELREKPTTTKLPAEIRNDDCS
jgi:hypothetical protein